MEQHSHLNLVKEVFFIKNGQTLHRLNIHEVEWISAEGNYTTFMTPSRKYVAKISLKKTEQLLPQSFFVRIHRNYIVQLAKISKIDTSSNTIFIESKTLPMGRSYRDTVLKKVVLID